MTDIQFHAAQQRAAELGLRLREILARIDDPRARDLSERVDTHPHHHPKLVFTGQYSSGKSTLIKALTNGAAAVVIDSDVSTDRVVEFDWDGLLSLVDTPGVQAGLASHDALAEEAIVSADLVLFTVTVDLFDDMAMVHLHHVAETLGKRDQLLVVITKANTMPADGETRSIAIAEALSSIGGPLPWVESDARDYLDGLEHPDTARGAAYREMSRLDAVRAAINDISARRGELARFRQPLQMLIAIALEAESLQAEDPNETAALALLARQRSALSARRERIDANLDDIRSGFLSASTRSAEDFVHGIDAIEDLPEGELRAKRVGELTDQLNGHLNDAADRMGEAIMRALDIQFDDLASEVREIEASPHASVVLGLSPEVARPRAESDVRVQGASHRGAAGVEVPAWAPAAGRWLKEFHVRWGAGAGVKASSGTVGHKVVLEVGHRFGAKFKPWQAARVANRIGRAAKVGSVLISVGIEVASVVITDRAEVAAERERQGRRVALVNEVTRQAELIAEEALADVRRQLEPVFTDAYTQIDRVHGDIVSARTQRSMTSRELTRIGDEASRALLELG